MLHRGELGCKGLREMLTPLEVDLRALPGVEEVSCNYHGNCQVLLKGFEILETQPRRAHIAPSKLHPERTALQPSFTQRLTSLGSGVDYHSDSAVGPVQYLPLGTPVEAAKNRDLWREMYGEG